MINTPDIVRLCMLVPTIIGCVVCLFFRIKVLPEQRRVRRQLIETMARWDAYKASLEVKNLKDQAN